ncbi:MAG: glycine/betaine ABC transporter substrate-binding protein [Streptosporangiales bacterium]|nr:glycine/betaine ABC transporter substrate-binding protein [Streptosporangiales bacterium]
MIRTLRGAAIGLAAALALTACGGGGDSGDPLKGGGGGEGGQVVVGSANFPENQLLGEIYAQALEAKGVKVQRKLNIGSREVIYNQVKSGGLTVLPEYTGALLAFIDPKTTAANPEEIVTELKQKLPAELELLNTSKAENKDSVTVTKKTADANKIATIEDLKPVAENMVIGAAPEFKERQQGLKGLESVYGLDFKSFKELDTDGPITWENLNQDQVQVANVYTTNPQIAKNGWVVLQDPKNLFSAQQVTPLVYKKGANETVRSTLNAISARLTTQDLIKLMERVAIDKDDYDTVAGDWLKEKSLA